MQRQRLLKVMHSLSGVLAQTVARDLLCKDSLIIASSTPQVSHFYIARAYPIIQSTCLIPPFDRGPAIPTNCQRAINRNISSSSSHSSDYLSNRKQKKFLVLAVGAKQLVTWRGLNLRLPRRLQNTCTDTCHFKRFVYPILGPGDFRAWAVH